MNPLSSFAFNGFKCVGPCSKGKKPQCTGTQKAGCTFRMVPEVAETGYSQEWYDRVVGDGDNKEHYAAYPGEPASQGADTAAVAAANTARSYELHKRLRMNKKRPPPRGPPSTKSVTLDLSATAAADEQASISSSSSASS